MLHFLVFLVLLLQIPQFHTFTPSATSIRWRRAVLSASSPSTNEFPSGEETAFEAKSNRSLTVIRSIAPPPRWMLSVGGSQEEIELLHYSSQQYRPKSVQMDFSLNSNIPIPTILYDQLENLDAMVTVNRIDYERLKRKVRDRNRLFGHILVEACASETPSGELQMTTVWSENLALTSAVLLVTDANTVGERAEVEQKLMDGYLPVSVCGYQRRDTSVSHYLIVFVRPQNLPMEMSRSLARVKIGQPLSDCLQQDRVLARKGLSAQRLHVHSNSRGELKCAAIYWPMPASTVDHFINQGTDLKQLYLQVLQRKNGREHAPKSVSRIMIDGREEFVVLWGRGTPIWALPPAMPLRQPGYAIPFQYTAGVPLEMPTQLLSFFNHRIMEFMQRYDLPGVTVAVAKNEHLKLAAGFGYANMKSGEQLTPTHKFRLGSISKVVTATALALLIDEGVLGLDERVFGENSVFGYDFAITNDGQYSEYVDQITVRHLMSHTVGAWPNTGMDPVFSADPSLTSVSQLIQNTLRDQPLKQPPGLHFQYSNFGYVLLGEVIAKKTGLSYVDFVNERLFEAVGMPKQQLLSVDMNGADEEDSGVLYYPTSEMSDDPYELPSPSILAACCGWSMAPTDLLKFLTHADGFPLKEELISAEMFALLGTPTKESNYTYGLGWTLNDKGFNGRSHQGQMPSALSVLVRTDNGIELVIATNRFPPRMMALSEMSYLAHHLIGLFEGPEMDNFDHFVF